MKTDTVNIRLPRDLVAAYREIALGKGVSLNAAAAHGLRRALDTVALSAASEDEAIILAAFRRAVARATNEVRTTPRVSRPTAPIPDFPSIDPETTLDACDFSVRTSNALETFCLSRSVPWATATLADLARMATEGDLLRTRNFARRSSNEIREALAAVGLTLREE